MKTTQQSVIYAVTVKSIAAALIASSCSTEITSSVKRTVKQMVSFKDQDSIEGTIDVKAAAAELAGMSLSDSSNCLTTPPIYLRKVATFANGKYTSVEKRIATAKVREDGFFKFVGLQVLDVKIDSSADVLRLETEICGREFSRILTVVSTAKYNNSLNSY